MRSSFKPHNNLVRLGQWPSSPLRTFRAQTLAYGVYAAFNFAQQDVSDRIVHGNVNNFHQFMAKAMNKLEAKWAAQAMFAAPGGLIH